MAKRDPDGVPKKPHSSKLLQMKFMQRGNKAKIAAAAPTENEVTHPHQLLVQLEVCIDAPRFLKRPSQSLQRSILSQPSYALFRIRRRLK